MSDSTGNARKQRKRNASTREWLEIDGHEFEGGFQLFVPLLNTGLVFVGDQSIVQRKLLIVEDKRKDTVGAIVVMGCLGLRLPMELETLLGLSHVRYFLTRPINGCLCEVIFLDNLQHRCNPALSACVGCWMSMAARSICLRGLQARPWRINSPPKLLEFLRGLLDASLTNGAILRLFLRTPDPQDAMSSTERSGDSKPRYTSSGVIFRRESSTRFSLG